MRAADPESFPEPPPPITREPWFKWVVLTVVLGFVASVLLAGAGIFFLVRESSLEAKVLPEHRSAPITLGDLLEVFPELGQADPDEEFSRFGGSFFLPELSLTYSCYADDGEFYIDSEVYVSHVDAETADEWELQVSTLEDDWSWLISSEEESITLHWEAIEGVGEAGLFVLVEQGEEIVGSTLMGRTQTVFLRLDLYGLLFEDATQASELLREQLEELEALGL